MSFGACLLVLCSTFSGEPMCRCSMTHQQKTRLAATALAMCAVCLAVSSCTQPVRDTDRRDLQIESPPESRGLLPIIGYQVPLTRTERDPDLKYKVVYLMPSVASAPLNAKLPAPLKGCTVVPEVTGEGANSVMVNMWLKWTPGRAEDSSECKYDPTIAKEAYILIEGIPPNAVILTGGPIAEVDRSEAESATLGNKIPQLPEERPPGG
jgi:hypothetical protein